MADHLSRILSGLCRCDPHLIDQAAISEEMALARPRYAIETRVWRFTKMQIVHRAVGGKTSVS
jgi:hypothetical protein